MTIILADTIAVADGLPMTGKPESVGLSSQRLQRITSTFNADVATGRIPGAVVLVARRGKTAYLQAVGFQDRDKQLPMQRDSIFRIASMTKPVVAVAALMLMEEGKLALIDPVSRYLPEFKDLKVGVEQVDAATGQRHLTLEPLRRPITVQDLLRHTSGLTYGPFGDSLVQRLYRENKVMDDQQTNAEMVTKLAALPLAFQPGTTFEYSMSTDVVGRIVEVVSGMNLEQFVRERITAPLRMSNTGFLLDERNAARLALPQSDPVSGTSGVLFAYVMARPPKWFSGGGGMLSTAADYARFCQMLLNSGELDGVRLLSRDSVALMTSDHLPPGAGFGTFTQELGITAPLPEFGQGYGLGIGVRKEQGRSPVPGSVGDFYWGGALGTYFWVDPQKQLIAVMMLQEIDITKRTQYRSVLRNLVYQALDDG
ncbi:MAG: serine hydrolase domain-containing protein [Pseudomonadota bacterium]